MGEVAKKSARKLATLLKTDSDEVLGGSYWVMIQFIPNHYALQWGEHCATYVRQPNALEYSNSHCLIEYSGELQAIVGVADKYGLRHRFRERFGGPLYELWLEDNLLIEFVSEEIKNLGA